MPNKVTPPLERFMRHVEITDTCWNWIGGTGGSKSTYGYFHPGTRSSDAKVVAHRYSYRSFVGEIPEGMQIDHLCRNSLCVRPDHLEAVTPQENMRRARLTVCKNGHDLTDDANCYYDRQGRRRGCIICARDRALARFRAMKERSN